MKYLTQYADGMEPLWAAYVGKHIWAEEWAGANIGRSKLCIIDINEHDACVLALQGHRLFTIDYITLTPTSQLFCGLVYVKDSDAVLEWVSTCYT